MPNDPRAAIFRPLDEVERSFRHLDPAARRAARRAHLADAISLYDDELRWTHGLKPHRLVWYLVPLTWPVLWYRHGLSQCTLSAISRAIHERRSRWADDLRESGLSFDHIRDPLQEPERD